MKVRIIGSHPKWARGKEVVVPDDIGNGLICSGAAVVVDLSKQQLGERSKPRGRASTVRNVKPVREVLKESRDPDD